MSTKKQKTQKRKNLSLTPDVKGQKAQNVQSFSSDLKD